ncbi:STAS domain-containing protein [Streptomyces erythrochromogenes]|uniref:STAS domain-containing protein n=1 Tax=Streptomyces erythrochromogenes TaxID=285574 RepID=UPI0036AA539E
MEHNDEAAGPGAAVVRVSGELDIDRAPALRTELNDAIASAPDSADVAVDLSAMSFCDSSGLNALLGARLHAEEAGHLLRLVAPSAQMVRLLEMTGAIHVFTIDPAPPA